jgi:DNA mismatch endonuclease (patch repair protein)
VQFWKRKIAANRARDAKVTAELEALGWNVLTVWECELADVNRLVQRLKESLALLSVELLQKKEEGAGNA